MNNSKVSTAHLQRLAYVYIRQSTATQVEHNRESTDRQYKLIDRARGLGWPNERIKVVDTDLAKSADGTGILVQYSSGLIPYWPKSIRPTE